MKKQPMEKILIDIGRDIKYYLLVVLICITLASCQSEKKLNNYAMNVFDNSTIVKMIIDHPDIQQYYHPDVEGRVPLVIVTNNLIENKLALTKFNEPVKFYNKPIDGVFLEITRYDISEDEIIFELMYSEEGVSANGKISKQPEGWIFNSFDIFEN